MYQIDNCYRLASREADENTPVPKRENDGIARCRRGDGGDRVDSKSVS